MKLVVFIISLLTVTVLTFIYLSRKTEGKALRCLSNLLNNKVLIPVRKIAEEISCFETHACGFSLTHPLPYFSKLIK